MPYIISRTWYPPSKMDETAKKYLEVLEKFPFDESLGKQVVPVAITVSKDGLETQMIVEVEIPKVGEALEPACRVGPRQVVVIDWACRVGPKQVVVILKIRC